MDGKDFDLEQVYDSQIAPLMEQIISVCKEHKMPMFATFFYKSDEEDDYTCTTNLFFDERPNNEKLRQLEPMMRRRPGFFAMTITSPKS